MKSCFLGLLLSFQFSISAQNAVKIWYFGEFAGLDFRSGAPVPILNSAMKTYEGSSVITDRDDNLLFYTNGEKVWNKLHQVMINGDSLFGNTDCVHPSTVIKISKLDSTIYYVFTCDATGRKKGLQYSVVDMNKQFGLGEVIKKNVFLHNNMTEKVVAIPHANRCDAWLISHEFQSARFFVYPVTDRGIGNPIINNIGSVQPYGNAVGSGAQGQIAASPDGAMIAMASFEGNEFQIFRFNNATGSISDPITISLYSKPWGVVFSPNGKKLYTTRGIFPHVYQFDISIYDEAAINSSALLLGNVTCPDPNIKAGAMQIGPDDKIYITKWNSDYLSVIDKPNLQGAACGLIDNGVYLGGRKSQFGLPSFTMMPIDTISKKSIISLNLLGNDTSLCAPVFYKLSVNHPSPIWFNKSSDQEIIIRTSGTYWVSFEDCNSVYTDTIEIKEILSSLDVGKDTSICEGETVNLNGTSIGQSNVLWLSTQGNFDNPNKLNTNYYPNSIGDHHITLISDNGCGQQLDSLIIQVHPKQIVQIIGDTIIDPCHEITFTASGGNNFTWTPTELFDCLNPTCSKVRMKSHGSVSFVISSDGMCVVPANFNLSLSQIQFDINIPNVFSPNGDQINDIFLPIINCIQLDYYNLEVFNRWGNLIFESHNKEIGWSGDINGVKLNPGVFTYVIQYQFPGSSRKIKTGDVTLVK